jgi:sugar phosphate isomerase/epimerase
MISAVSRRSLLGGFIGSGLVWEMTRAGVARDGAARKFTVDLVCGNIGVRARLPEAIALAQKYGFESVAPDAGYLKSLSDSQISELREDLKTKRLVWGAAGLPVDFRGPVESFRKGLNGLPADAKALNRAGASRMGTWISPGHNSLTYLSNFKQHESRLREVGKILGDHGIRLGLEYVGPKTSWSATRYPFIHTMAEMHELIAVIDQPNIGLVLDSWHWYTAHETEADLLGLKGSDVVCCDLNDAPPGIPVDQQKDNMRDLPCATGVIDLKAFLGALVKIGFDGPARAEPFKAELRRLPPQEAVELTAQAMKRAVRLIS